MNTYFTADTHFGHKNIIKYAHRPFNSVEEMDESLISYWNTIVTPEDIIYHLGDFAFSKNPEKYFYRLNGKKILICGNHDSQLTKQLQWDKVRDYLEIKVNGQFIVLMHYAMKVWNKSHYGSWQLYGHSHGTLPDDSNSRSMDVGVDCFNYAPVSFETLEILMALKKFMPIDHHE